MFWLHHCMLTCVHILHTCAEQWTITMFIRSSLTVSSVYFVQTITQLLESVNNPTQMVHVSPGVTTWSFDVRIHTNHWSSSLHWSHYSYELLKYALIMWFNSMLYKISGRIAPPNFMGLQTVHRVWTCEIISFGFFSTMYFYTCWELLVGYFVMMVYIILSYSIIYSCYFVCTIYNSLFNP